MSQLHEDWPAESVLRLTISNPGKRNALDHSLLDAIAAGVHHSDARCVILTGAHGMFSSGYDIRDIADDAFPVEAEKLVAHPSNVAIDAIEACEIPTIAACTGHAIGGGLELAVACDFRVAGEGIKMAMTPANLGLVYSHTGLQRFIDTVGAARTRELFLLGRELDAATAAQWGLVTEVSALKDVPATAVQLALRLVSLAPLSIRGNKRIIRSLLAARWSMPPEDEDELLALRQACFRSRDLREGVRAFGERRAARWEGA